ncbi:hypothetical protein [Streptomyces sp. GC420]|uniref:hypothetical protein n=1 Tax=Streptomyces sp. GC420 TaxID=2697568 RepID=UPI001FB62C1A|nr:hypothetical protein [Streptomyces sp. GC420]
MGTPLRTLRFGGAPKRPVPPDRRLSAQPGGSPVRLRNYGRRIPFGGHRDRPGLELRGQELPGGSLGAREEHGFEPHRQAPAELQLLNYPFHRPAARSPQLVCGINHAFLDGFLTGLEAAGIDAVLAARPGRCCVELRAGAGSVDGTGAAGASGMCARGSEPGAP